MRSGATGDLVQSPSLARPPYRPDIDGLRAVAVISVVGFHALPNAVPGGFVGVDVFFVISGFLITSLIIENVHARQFSLREFYARRIKRIFPALAVVLAACYLLGWNVLFQDEFAQLGKHIAGGAGFISNLILWREAGYFDTSAEIKPLLHLWSLGIEEQFYLVWPLLIVLALRFRINLLFVALTVAIASFTLNVLRIHHDATGVFYSPVSRIWEPLVGCALAYVAATKKVTQSRHVGSGWFGTFADDLRSLAGIALIAMAVLFVHQQYPFPGWWALLPTLGTAWVLTAGSSAWINRIVLSNKLLVWIGLISYPLYLWHWPLLAFARILSFGQMTLELRVTAVIVSVGLAALTYHLIERPIRGDSAIKLAAPLCVAMMVLGLIGLSTSAEKGFPFRVANLNARMFANDGEDAVVVSDDSCERLLGETEGANETCLANDPRPVFMVLGDSHARTFNSAAYFGKSPLKTLLISGSSCLPFLDYIIRSPGEDENKRDCDRITAKAVRAVSQIASISTVILVTMGPDYFAGREVNGAKINAVPFRRGASIPSDPRSTFIDGYVDTAKRFIALKKRVVFVVDVPELGFDPHNCIVRSLALAALPACQVSKDKVEDRQTEYRTFVRMIVQANPSMRVFDTMPTFCSSKECIWYDDQGALYFDAHHLSVHGSNLLLAAFSQWQVK